MVIKGYRIKPLLAQVVRETGKDNISTLAASAAYKAFFSLFPLLLFLAPLLTLVGDKQVMTDFLTTRLTSVLPAEQAAAFRPVLTNVIFAPNAPGLMSIGILLAAWSGSNVFGTLMVALNTAYDVHETRGLITQQLIRLMTFIVSVVIVVISTVIFLQGATIADGIGSLLHLGPAAILAWKVLQYPIALAGLIGLLFMIFYLLPNVEQHKTYALVGAAVTTFLWLLATLIFRIYIAHFPPNQAYGVIGGVIILLSWMYCTMFVLLIGGELASELQHGTGAVTPDKGAIYIGRIVTGEGPGRESAAPEE